VTAIPWFSFKTPARAGRSFATRSFKKGRDLHSSILELGERFRQRSLSPVELTKDCLARIARLDPAIHAFITVTSDSALDQARRAEAEIARGDWRGPLHGIPLAVKDLIDTAGVRSTAGSALFQNRIPREDAEVVRRLQHAGAVLLGKQNLHEFAYGGSSVIGYYGAVHNPWNLAHIAGGSSGGSAAAVAAGFGYGAIGTDTSGSIRQPAALCGVVGLKPTYGRVSARGVIPLAPSLDHIGPIAARVEDVAVILDAIAGFDPGGLDPVGLDRNDDPHDPASRRVPAPDYARALRQKPGPLRIGVPRSFFYEELDPEVAAATDNALQVLGAMAGDMREIELPVPTDRSLQSAEAYAYHAEFIARTPELYEPETLRRIESGRNLSARDIPELRNQLQTTRREIVGVFENVDVLVTPTTPVVAPTIARLLQDRDQLRARELVLLRNTRPFNIWGLPAVSVPCGFTAAGLPMGLQISGPHWQEGRVLQLAYAYERATAWHLRQPPDQEPHD
jgi:aspartyl-tRNA(Asn)/glutamyl-tRNA(Gln) amidotransferase subunit A